MKSLNTTKRVQIILATLFVIVVAAIIVGKVTNDNALGAAVTSCPNCLTRNI